MAWVWYRIVLRFQILLLKHRLSLLCNLGQIGANHSFGRHRRRFSRRKIANMISTFIARERFTREVRALSQISF
jgi:hypothetical protein